MKEGEPTSSHIGDLGGWGVFSFPPTCVYVYVCTCVQVCIHMWAHVCGCQKSTPDVFLSLPVSFFFFRAGGGGETQGLSLNLVLCDSNRLVG